MLEVQTHHSLKHGIEFILSTVVSLKLNSRGFVKSLISEIGDERDFQRLLRNHIMFTRTRVCVLSLHVLGLQIKMILTLFYSS